MNNVKQDLKNEAVRRLPVWLYVGALPCLAVGALLLLRVPLHRTVAAAEPALASADQSAEIERLKQAVALLQQKSVVLAAAVAPADRAAEPRRTDDEPKAPAPVKVTRSAEEIKQEGITQLEARFVAESDGSRDNLLATRTLETELGAAPLNGARIAQAACAASLCRTTLEHDVSATPPDIAALIEATPSVRREALFDYTEEGSTKRVTIYSAREGHRLSPSPADTATALP